MIYRSLLAYLLCSSMAVAQLDFERPPISYSETAPCDPVSRLGDRIEAGEVSLEWQPGHGYLRSLLTALDIDESSQTLVFSKTSLQVSRISPGTPRAIYFNDDVYVGWVQRGDLIEISAADPALGGTFYTLEQNPTGSPVLQRETSRCLQCHGSTHTRRIPGHIVRSVYPDSSGQPVFRLGTSLNDHTTDFQNRWGGWYVTGTHGEQRHMGNSWLEDPDTTERLDMDGGANLRDLSALLDTGPYLTPHSDIVALMVLAHQVHMHNVLTAANHSGRLTARDSEIMNRALERELDYQSESISRRYDSAAEKVVKALLLVDETRLTAPVQGTSDFAQNFSRRGPFDPQNRSLRTLDLTQRLFRWPCSFLVYSDSFRALPEGVMKRVVHRLNDVFSGRDQSDDFQHLTVEDRSAILDILLATTDLRLETPSSP
ncbi:MAG: hypothetical protein RIK87_03525 [Fuerstiella sp.]